MLRPFGDGVLVRLNPPAKRSTTIELPTNESNIRTGVVVRTGPGKHKKGLQVAEGEKVAFVRWHLEHKNGKSVSTVIETEEPGCVLIQQRDILFVYDDETLTLDT